MDDEIKLKKCYLCEKEVFAIIRIEVAPDNFFNDKGICSACFKDGNFDEKVFLKHTKFLQEQVDKANERKKFWEKELNNLSLK